MIEDLGRYKILEEIGQGGFAIVYRARDTELDRLVALKELRPTLLHDTEWVKGFKREARTIARLDQPRIVTIFDVVEMAERLFIAMRLVDGASLDELIASQRGLPWPQVMEILTAVSEALDYAHAQDVLHRDLKPANILLDSKRGPLLSDFGLAKLVGEASTNVTAGGGVVGTPHYIAPEVWEGEGTTPQSDIYALGCILYEMVTGEKLFGGESAPAVMMAHFTPLTLPHTWPEGVPSGVTDVLTTALAKHPGDRYATAGELVTALTNLVKDKSAELSHAIDEAGRDAGPRRPEPADTSIQLPSFLEAEAEPAESDRAVLVDREGELAQLDSFLESALTGQGRVVFVTGEAGQGKTSLLQEFVQRAQKAQPNLIAASGTCDVYTGVGDPYLPFRDVLNMLTGDVEAQWAAGTISRDHTLRLWHLIPQAVEALVERSPDLVETFVSGKALASRVAAYAAAKPDRLDRMQELTAHLTGPSAGQDPDQSRLFEQYTAVLAALASRQPLLLILDDLHWADLSSISLLDHLGRRMTKHPMLIVGAYRPEDVAQGWEDEQHPLEGILTEFKRQFGDVWVRLDQAVTTRDRAFIDAFLDTEPNRLDENFRQELARHTGGHPLFTVELLRHMQERGDVVQDEQGHWAAEPNLNWQAFPVRIEGIIERRIGRLDPELREALTVASVEGEEFTAEVIAQVRQIEKRELIRRLSSELGQQQRLVQDQGILRVGSRRLSRYRFRHNLFQKYLYQSLGEVECAYLHEDVGNALEELYSDRREEIAVQLARHFQTAGLVEKTIDYLQQAGDAAAQVYANTEAIAHYRRALELAKQGEVNTGQLIHLYTHLGRTLELMSQFDQALAIYQEMEQLADQRGERAMELTALVHQGRLRCTANAEFDQEQGETLSERALQLAQALGDRVSEAQILRNLLNLYRLTNRTSQAIDCGERSLALTRELNLREQMAFTLNDIAHCYAAAGQRHQSLATAREASDLWRELGNLPMLTDSLALSSLVCVYSGKFDRAIALSEEAFEISHSISNLWGQSYSRGIIGYAYWQRGQPDRAIAAMEEGLRLGELAGYAMGEPHIRPILAAAYGSLGAIDRGLENAQRALAVAEARFPIFRSYDLSILARLHLWHNQLTAAKTAIDQARNDPNWEALEFFSMYVLLVESEVSLRQGNHEHAQAVTDELLVRLRQSGIRLYIPHALNVQGQALSGLGQVEAAHERLQEARAEAEALGSRWPLWQILALLTEIETDPIEVDSLRQQAQGIIEYIADHTPTPELRTSFLNLPHVRAVLDS